MGVIWVVTGQWSSLLTITIRLCCRVEVQTYNSKDFHSFKINFVWVKREKIITLWTRASLSAAEKQICNNDTKKLLTLSLNC